MKKPKRIRLIYCPYCGYPQIKDRELPRTTNEVQVHICLNLNCLQCFQTEHAHTELVENPYP